jgi:hypothetical protein
MGLLFAVGYRPSLVRRHNPPECQAARQPHSPVRCLVELVRAECTREGQQHEQPVPGQETAGAIRA